MERVLDYLMGDMKHKLLFCWVSTSIPVPFVHHLAPCV